MIEFFIFGISVGSFLNVLIDRLPRQESVVKGRSRCESCKHELSWIDLIPLLSFIFLKGKCRYCGSRLSFYYPIVEFVTGFLFLWVLVTIGEIRGIREIGLIAYYLFAVSSLVAIFFTDLKYGIIPDKIVYPAIVVSFFSSIFTSEELWLTQTLNSVLSAFGAFLFFLFLFLSTRGRGMGFGDVKFAFLIGLMLGFPSVVAALYLAFLTGAITSLILVLCGRKKFVGGTVPFGPFLAIGALAGLFYGEDLIRIVLLIAGLR